ncbi:S24 family peptidase [Ectobacillus polymachus]|uniref:S24 family peptidase n=1 Tax=Ectobacillus polymachus TaxID=1508806 RepID=UPI003A8C0943
MDYYQRLNKMIEDSKLTLKEIADRCEEFGVKINPSYISKLRSNKQPPASDEVNKAIAMACDFKEFIDDFLFESYMEKAPEEIKTFFNEIISLSRTILYKLGKQKIPEEMFLTAKKQAESLSDRAALQSAMQELKALFATDRDMGIDAEATELNPIKMIDNSMQPGIPEGAVLELDTTESIKNGDIVVVTEDNQNDYLVRRYFEVDEKIILLGDYPSPFIIEFRCDQINIIGKVKSYSVTIEN